MPAGKDLSKAEYKRMVQAALKKGNKRLAMIIQTLCSLGIRASELSGITAESAIALAIQEVPISLIGANVLITGYGRISKALLQRLPAMGARVYIAARKCADRAEITARGCKSLSMDLLPQAAAAADIIMNTVPAPLFTKEVLCAVKSESLLIDLASKPGGVAFDAARELGVRTIWALSLPGKTAPISAGEIILETIENCLTEQEAG